MVFSAVGDAFHRTADLLFKPFSFKRWVQLVLIAWLAGALFGGFSLNWNTRSNQAPQNEEQTVSKRKAAPLNAALSRQVERQHEKKYWFEHSLLKTFRNESGQIPSWYMNVIVWPLLIFVVLLILALLLAWIWLASRFQFVWLHAVQTGEVGIRRAFRKFELPADWLTTFWVLALVVAFLYYTAVLFLPAYFLFSAAKSAPLLFKSGPFLLSTLWPWLLLLLFSIAVTLVLWSVLSDFVVPLMAADTLPVRAAFGKWLAIYRGHRWAVWRYFMMKFLAAILGGAFSTAASLVVMIAFGLAGAAVFGLTYLLFMTWLKLKVVFLVVAVFVGAPFFTVMVLSLGACSLPVSLFFRSFSLSFLEKLTSETS